MYWFICYSSVTDVARGTKNIISTLGSVFQDVARHDLISFQVLGCAIVRQHAKTFTPSAGFGAAGRIRILSTETCDSESSHGCSLSHLNVSTDLRDSSLRAHSAQQAFLLPFSRAAATDIRCIERTIYFSVIASPG